jgi:hypothetical protein
MTAPETTAPPEPEAPAPEGDPYPADPWPEITRRYIDIEAEARANIARWHADARAVTFARHAAPRPREHAAAAVPDLPLLPVPEPPEPGHQPERRQRWQWGLRGSGRHVRTEPGPLRDQQPAGHAEVWQPPESVLPAPEPSDAEQFGAPDEAFWGDKPRIVPPAGDQADATAPVAAGNEEHQQ